MVSNHISCLDFMLAMKGSILCNIKTKKMPIFGSAAESSRCIFVDRKTEESREKATK